MVVVFPAPLIPSSPKHSPGAMPRLTLFTATFPLSYTFVNWLRTIRSLLASPFATLSCSDMTSSSSGRATVMSIVGEPPVNIRRVMTSRNFFHTETMEGFVLITSNWIASIRKPIACNMRKITSYKRTSLVHAVLLSPYKKSRTSMLIAFSSPRPRLNVGKKIRRHQVRMLAMSSRLGFGFPGSLATIIKMKHVRGPPRPIKKPDTMTKTLQMAGEVKAKDTTYENPAAAGPKQTRIAMTPDATFLVCVVSTATSKAYIRATTIQQGTM
mmetsp:Transcript_8760/g.16793  ORF Transcript_8760/g.16793 Transcript_8760/m.16793 type:complete len:269 (+) Transcript_8760:1148-1954(+)